MMKRHGERSVWSGRCLLKKTQLQQQRAFPLIAFLLSGLLYSCNNGTAAPSVVTTAMALASSSSSLPPLSKTADHWDLAQRALVYLDKSTDPFHAVQTSIDRLSLAGFMPLSSWDDVRLGGKYYYTRNRSTLVAFAVGGRYDQAFTVIGGHTDSPNLRVKPRSKRTSAGCIQLGVECYGGGLWHTWFDRDLGVSGRVLVRTSNSDAGGANNNVSTIQQRLVQIDRPLCRISNLAIHLQTASERDAFKVNKEDDLSPILALEVKKALEGNNKKKDDSDDESSSNGDINNNNENAKNGWFEYQEPALLQILADDLQVNVKDIVDFELSLFDVQKAAIGGVFSEFLYSARLDNLASCFLAVEALAGHAGDNGDDDKSSLADQQDVSMIILYDHEEVGSTSAVGAAAPILQEAIKCISTALGQGESAAAVDRCVQRSFVLSSDQAHAVHPNYASKHEKIHQPKMNQGMVIKRNSNQRYATNVITGAILREIARTAGLPPIQEFLVRQDCGCGSTIGPTISAAAGTFCLDVVSTDANDCVVLVLGYSSAFSHTVCIFASYQGSEQSTWDVRNFPCIPFEKLWGSVI
jgi:aspartyl aminopeptidase